MKAQFMLTKELLITLNDKLSVVKRSFHPTDNILEHSFRVYKTMRIAQTNFLEYCECNMANIKLTRFRTSYVPFVVLKNNDFILFMSDQIYSTWCIGRTYYDDLEVFYFVKVPTVKGDYARVYDDIYECIVNNKPQVIKQEETMLQMEILENGVSHLK